MYRLTKIRREYSALEESIAPLGKKALHAFKLQQQLRPVIVEEELVAPANFSSQILNVGEIAIELESIGNFMTCFIPCMAGNRFSCLFLLGEARELHDIAKTTASVFKLAKAHLVLIDPPYGYNKEPWDTPESVWDSQYWYQV